MNVEDVMTPGEEVVTVEIPGTRDDALEYLQDEEFSSVPAVKRTPDGTVYRGIVSRSALIEYPDEDQLALLAEEVSAVSPETSLDVIGDRMLTEGERRVPVVEDDELRGIVTVTDVVRAIARGEGESMQVDEVASPTINTVYSETPLTVAERELAYAQTPYGVVLDEDGVAGMLTEVDILDVARVVEGETGTGDSIANQDDEWAWEGIKAVGNRYMPTRNVEIPTGPVSAFMTEDLITVSGTRSVEEVAQLLVEHDIEQIPVMNGGELVGIVQDILLLEALR